MNASAAVLEHSPCVLDAPALQRALVRLGHEVNERHGAMDTVVLAGVPTRGVPLAARLAAAITDSGGRPPAVVELDPRGHRDDLPRTHDGAAALRTLSGAIVPPITGSTVIVVDDVLFTGRTMRAAIDALVSAGRPAVVEVLVLVDRGHRELPIRATYVGKNVPTSWGERVAVRLREVDGVDGAWLVREGSA